jgi:hypothetical protein
VAEHISLVPANLLFDAESFLVIFLHMDLSPENLAQFIFYLTLPLILRATYASSFEKAHSIDL